VPQAVQRYWRQLVPYHGAFECLIDPFWMQRLTIGIAEHESAIMRRLSSLQHRHTVNAEDLDGYRERCAASTLRASLTICSHSVK
jgi:hypothetical protein